MSQNSVVIGEGKTKIVKTNPNDPATVFLYFKNDITAGDGAKHDVFEGKAVLDWAVSRDCFELLSQRGVITHYIDSPEERVMLVRKLDRKLELEVVTRRVATGSILKWGDCPEGERFDPVITQFHYKDDPLNDPMLDDRYVAFLIRDKNAWEYASMRQVNAQVFLVLEAAFAQYKSVLRIDFSLWPVEHARLIAELEYLPAVLDVGYAVLLDKDQLTDRLRPPPRTQPTSRRVRPEQNSIGGWRSSTAMSPVSPSAYCVMS
jgi:phosphoribosylaminoimidazole-succinocarboxamide synthase